MYPLDRYFWAKVVKHDEGCWEWTAATDKDGYGMMRPGKARAAIRASRISYTLNIGPIPDGMSVLHRCDNPPCTRPDHLFLGTEQDNSDDKIAKGRDRKADQTGENNNSGRLAEPQVLEIRRLCGTGLTQKEIGALFGVTHSMVSAIKLRKAWTHI